MQRYNGITRARIIEMEIQKKEILARDARKKGLYATYGNCMSDIAVLRSQLQKLNTGGPSREISK